MRRRGSLKLVDEMRSGDTSLVEGFDGYRSSLGHESLDLRNPAFPRHDRTKTSAKVTPDALNPHIEAKTGGTIHT